jgi:integrase
VLRELALIDLLFATGIRVGEASALDIRDFFAREAAFRVQGKGGRDRLAFIVDEDTVRIQRAHLEARESIKTEEPSALYQRLRPAAFNSGYHQCHRPTSKGRADQEACNFLLWIHFIIKRHREARHEAQGFIAPSLETSD